jgi:Sortase domain
MVSILRTLGIAVIAASIAAGVILAFTGSHALRWSPPPFPPRSEALPAAALPVGPPAGHEDQTGQLPQPMTRSVPLSLDIPRIRVRARIIPLGLRPDGSPAVPPLTIPFVTSWYDVGPTPGARGAAVIFGHVDSAAVGPAVFYSLGRLRVGNLIDVTLANRRTAVFSVYAAGLYPRNGFPALAV